MDVSWTRSRTFRRVRATAVVAAVAATVGLGAGPARAAGEHDAAHYCGVRGFFEPYYDDGAISGLVHQAAEPLGVPHRFTCDYVTGADGVVDTALDPGYVDEVVHTVVTDHESYLNQILHLCFLPACTIPGP
jgi:hypothetical protein